MQNDSSVYEGGANWLFGKKTKPFPATETKPIDSTTGENLGKKVMLLEQKYRTDISDLDRNIQDLKSQIKTLENKIESISSNAVHSTIKTRGEIAQTPTTPLKVRDVFKPKWQWQWQRQPQPLIQMPPNIGLHNASDNNNLVQSQNPYKKIGQAHLSLTNEITQWKKYNKSDQTGGKDDDIDYEKRYKKYKSKYLSLKRDNFLN